MNGIIYFVHGKKKTHIYNEEGKIRKCGCQKVRMWIVPEKLD